MKKALLIAVAALCACQGPSPTVPAQTLVPQSKQMASVTFVLKIPTVAPANGMRPHYISLGTTSFSVAVTLAGVSETTTNANASPSSPGCTSASGALLCSVQVDAPPGIDAFTVTTYDAPLTAAGATQGNVLSTGTANATVVLHRRTRSTSRSTEFRR